MGVEVAVRGIVSWLTAPPAITSPPSCIGDQKLVEPAVKKPFETAGAPLASTIGGAAKAVFLEVAAPVLGVFRLEKREKKIRAGLGTVESVHGNGRRRKGLTAVLNVIEDRLERVCQGRHVRRRVRAPVPPAAATAFR